jgi:hypothetical protein
MPAGAPSPPSATGSNKMKITKLKATALALRDQPLREQIAPRFPV